MATYYNIIKPAAAAAAGVFIEAMINGSAHPGAFLPLGAPTAVTLRSSSSRSLNKCTQSRELDTGGSRALSGTARSVMYTNEKTREDRRGQD